MKSISGDIRILIFNANTNITWVAKELTARTGKKYSGNYLAEKIRNGTVKYDEAKVIGDILGHDLKFCPRD